MSDPTVMMPCTTTGFRMGGRERLRTLIRFHRKENTGQTGESLLKASQKPSHVPTITN